MSQILRFVAVFAILSLSFSTLSAQATYCTPKYTGNGNPNTNQPTPFFTHVLRVSLADINRTIPSPASVFTSTIYQDFSSLDTARLTQTAKYPMTVELGNGANTQTFAVWIDYNQNNVFESVERITSRTDVANVGNHKYTFTISIPANAVTGYTRMRVGTLYGTKIPDPCNNSRPDNFGAQIADWSQNFQDYAVEIVKPNIQLFENVEVRHTNFDEIEIGSSANEILRIDVTTNYDGVISPLTVDTFYMSLMGSSDPKDIKRARLYYTGKNPSFHTNNLVDSLSNPSIDFALTSTNTLKQGTNYFWLAYDIENNALLGNRIDARCNGIHVVTKRIPSNINPGGDREIGYCDSKGNRSMFVYVRRVQLNTISVFSTWNNTGYQNFTNRTTNLSRGDSVDLTIDIGNGVNNSLTRAWIDFNADGDFNDPNEMVLFDSITTASPTTFTYGPVRNRFRIPPGAKVGPTRMRVSTNSKADAFPWKPAPNPCDEEVEIGEVEDYTVQIIEDGEPVSDFVFSTVCSGDSTSFIDRSYTFNTTFYQISSWNWDFGDGNTSTSQSPKHKYSNAGVYKVRLITNTTKPGTPDTTYKTVTVEDPAVDFSLSTTLSKTEIMFTDQTRNANVVYWEWDFGSPASPFNTAFGPSPFMIYDTTGAYDVKLLVRTQGGCEDSIIKTVNIVEALSPIANFNAADFEPYKTSATKMVDLSVNRPSKWTWKVTPSSFSFVNGTSASSQNAEIAFNNIATYTVTLVVENSAGTDSISREFKTKDYKKPEAEFSANRTNVKAGQIISFLDESTNDPTVWEWTFGNGDSSEVNNPNYQYELTGKYTVELKVENPAGKSSEKKIDFINVSDEYSMCESDVSSSPLFKGTLYDSGGKNRGYGNSENCEFFIIPECAGPITLAFSEFELETNDFVRVFDYDVDDDIRVPLHNGNGFTGYTKPANLKASLGAVIIEMETDRAGDSSGFKLVWSASPNVTPRAKIEGDSVGYVNSAMILENKTVIGTNNSYYWDTNNDGIDDDSSSTFVSVMFNKQGTDSVRLIAKNCKGVDTIYHIVKVDSATQVPTPNFYADKTTVYANDEIKFFDLSTQGPNRWKWEIKSDPFNYLFVNGTADTSRNPEIIFFEPGFYTVTLVATNDIGSSVKLTKNKYILVETRRTMCIFPFRDSAPGGRITDDGGENSIYNSRSCDFLIQPCAKEVILRFSEFDYRPGDNLFVYDGEDALGTPLHPNGGFNFSASPLGLTLIAKSGSVYIEHRATGFNSTYEGFVADWSSVAFDNPELDFDMPDTAYTGGNVVFFYDKTDNKGNSNLKWNWDFNNNRTVDDTVQNPTHQYARPGLFTVELRVDACEFRDSITKQIRVIRPNGKPKANFTVNQQKGATTDIFYFTDRSTNGPGVWRWEFDPPLATVVSGSDTFPTLGVTFNQADTYSVKLYVENSLGADSLVKQDHIVAFEYCIPSVDNPAPQIGISYFELEDIANSSEIGLAPYTNYSLTESTKLTRGGRHPVVVGRDDNQPSMNIKIWIDYNQDGDFNDTLETALTILASTSTLFYDTLVVPATVSMGTTRLRVGTSLGTNDNLPCGPNGFGEFEDYKVVIGPDETAPVISLIGPATVFAEVGYAYVDSGATAFDNIDGDLTSQITTTSNVDTSVAGNYTVTYDVEDAVGNKAQQVRRTVVVLGDQTRPIITLLGDDPLDMEVYSSFVDPGATATDNLDGDVSDNIVVEIKIDTARLGSYDVIYSAFDEAGNFALPVNRTVNVVDTEAPIITLRGSDNMVLEIGDTYVEDSADITDNYYTDVDLIISGGVNTNAVGTYEVYYDATDRSGNSATQQVRTVVVEDNIGLNEIAGLNKFEVYPNPASEQISVRLSAKTSLQGELNVYNALGKLIINEAIAFNGDKTLNYNIAKLSSGVYYIELISEDQSSKQKFTVTR
ncbi:MAG: DUF5011 domain-containing protein [Bacteroidia bacterium]